MALSSSSGSASRIKKKKSLLENESPEIVKTLKERKRKIICNIVKNRVPFTSPSINAGGNLDDAWIKFVKCNSTNSLNQHFVGSHGTELVKANSNKDSLIFWKHRYTGLVSQQDPATTAAYYIHTDQNVLEKVYQLRNHEECFEARSSSWKFRNKSVISFFGFTKSSKQNNNSYSSDKENTCNQTSIATPSQSRVSFLRSFFTREAATTSSTALYNNSNNNTLNTSPLKSCSVTNHTDITSTTTNQINDNVDNKSLVNTNNVVDINQSRCSQNTSKNENKNACTNIMKVSPRENSFAEIKSKFETKNNPIN